jgi:hypothetical protein
LVIGADLFSSCLKFYFIQQDRGFFCAIKDVQARADSWNLIGWSMRLIICLRIGRTFFYRALTALFLAGFFCQPVQAGELNSPENSPLDTEIFNGWSDSLSEEENAEVGLACVPICSVIGGQDQEDQIEIPKSDEDGKNEENTETDLTNCSATLTPDPENKSGEVVAVICRDSTSPIDLTKTRRPTTKSKPVPLLRSPVGAMPFGFSIPVLPTFNDSSKHSSFAPMSGAPLRLSSDDTQENSVASGSRGPAAPLPLSTTRCASLPQTRKEEHNTMFGTFGGPPPVDPYCPPRAHEAPAYYCSLSSNYEKPRPRVESSGVTTKGNHFKWKPTPMGPFDETNLADWEKRFRQGNIIELPQGTFEEFELGPEPLHDFRMNSLNHGQKMPNQGQKLNFDNHTPQQIIWCPTRYPDLEAPKKIQQKKRSKNSSEPSEINSEERPKKKRSKNS